MAGERQQHYSARSRIEGYFSLLKTGNIVAYGRLWARFTGLPGAGSQAEWRTCHDTADGQSSRSAIETTMTPSLSCFAVHSASRRARSPRHPDARHTHHLRLCSVQLRDAHDPALPRPRR